MIQSLKYKILSSLFLILWRKKIKKTLLNLIYGVWIRANHGQRENVHLSSFQTPLCLVCRHWLEKPASVFLQSFTSASLWDLTGCLSPPAPFADFNHSSVTRNQSHNPAKMLNQHKTRPRCRKDNRKPSCCEYWLPQRRPVSFITTEPAAFRMDGLDSDSDTVVSD